MAAFTIGPSTQCYLDLDIDDHRNKFARACAFVAANDVKYGLSSSDVRELGGGELKRLATFHESDFEWAAKGPIAPRPQPACRVVVELFDDTPLASRNFAALCAGAMGKAAGSGLPLHYRGSRVHRVQPGFVVQGGDFVKGNGSGGESVYGKKFKDESAGLKRRHDAAGVLSMGNAGKNANSSQFFFTLAPAPQCDGEHVVFGRVVSGLEVLRAVEAHGSASGEPAVEVTISECGLFPARGAARHGYWYDPPTEDGDVGDVGGAASRFVPVTRCACLAPSAEACARFAAALERAHDVEAHVLELAPGAAADAMLASAPGAPFDLVVAAPALAAKGEEGLPPGALVAKPADALAAIRAARAEAVS